MAEFLEGAQGRASIPASLVIRIHLDKLRSARGVDLDVSESKLKLDYLKGDVEYRLDVKLPYLVESEKGQAKFDKAQKVLQIVVPVKKVEEKIKLCAKKNTSGLVQEVEPSVTSDGVERANRADAEEGNVAPKDDAVAQNKEESEEEIDPDIRAAMEAAKLPFPAPPTPNVSDEPAASAVAPENTSTSSE